MTWLTSVACGLFCFASSSKMIELNLLNWVFWFQSFSFKCTRNVREDSVKNYNLCSGEERWLVTAFNLCGSLLCPEKVRSHTFLLCSKAVAPGRSTKKKDRKNPKPAQLDVPYGYVCESSWMLGFSLRKFKQSSLKKAISKCSWTPGQIFKHQPQIGCWLLRLCCCSGKQLKLFRQLSLSHLWMVGLSEPWRGWGLDRCISWMQWPGQQAWVHLK